MFTDYKYDLAYVESLIPFERELHIGLIMEGLKDQDLSPTRQFEAPED
jgi:hypothetical protein